MRSHITILALLVATLFAANAGAMGELGLTPETNTPTSKSGCVVGGCSSQLCLDAATADGLASTCEWTPQYACYRTHGTCERQPNGQCGWGESPALKACIANPPGGPQ